MMSAPVAPQSDTFMCMQLAGKYAMSVKGTKQKLKRRAVAVVIEEEKVYLKWAAEYQARRQAKLGANNATREAK